MKQTHISYEELIKIIEETCEKSKKERHYKQMSDEEALYYLGGENALWNLELKLIKKQYGDNENE